MIVFISRGTVLLLALFSVQGFSEPPKVRRNEVALTFMPSVHETVILKFHSSFFTSPLRFFLILRNGKKPVGLSEPVKGFKGSGYRPRPVEDIGAFIRAHISSGDRKLSVLRVSSDSDLGKHLDLLVDGGIVPHKTFRVLERAYHKSYRIFRLKLGWTKRCFEFFEALGDWILLD